MTPYMGYCTNQIASGWARGHKLQVTFKMTFTEHIEPVCRVVVRAWVHRMQWLMDHELAYGGADFKWTPAIFAGYEVPDEFRNLVPTLTKAKTLTRVRALRSIPRLA